MTEASGKSNKYIEKFLGIIEKVGNKLPHHTNLCALLAL